MGPVERSRLLEKVEVEVSGGPGWGCEAGHVSVVPYKSTDIRPSKLGVQ